MKFCRSNDTRTVGVFSRIAKDLSLLRVIKASLLQKLKKVKYELVESVLQTRDTMFDFTEIEDLKTCVMKVANCNQIRLNNPIKNCAWKRQGSGQLVCNVHKQIFFSCVI